MSSHDNDPPLSANTYYEQSGQLRERVTALETKLETELRHRPTKEDLEKLRNWTHYLILSLVIGILVFVSNVLVRLAFPN